VRRLHFPFYEQARLYIDVAKRDGFIEGENEISAMLPRTLKSLVDEYADGDWEDEQAAILLSALSRTTTETRPSRSDPRGLDDGAGKTLADHETPG
jgi:hypothetical protein